jgi:hypothetical protein
MSVYTGPANPAFRRHITIYSGESLKGWIEGAENIGITVSWANMKSKQIFKAPFYVRRA